jgi:solute carrier family 25 (mitochondrial S-adenosylmethionine transporter), member 26
MGAISGAFAAACTTPLDVIKTQMMTAAAQRPSMGAAARTLWKTGGPRAFFRCGLFPVWLSLVFWLDFAYLPTSDESWPG